MKILFTASECVPFVKTGGLADVVGALAPVLAKKGHDVRVILPMYTAIAQKWQEQMQYLLDFDVQLGWRRQYCGVQMLKKDGVIYYFLDNKYYFGRPYIYGLGGDEYERYGFFCRACLNALPLLDFSPDIIHAHDWQSGMIPALLKIQYAHLPFYAHIRTMFTIHNLQYQGIFGIKDVQDVLGLGDGLWTSDKLECFGCANFMKAGLVYADAITTVSPSYAEEITTAYYGERLDGLIRARRDSLYGVLNGIDVDEYNPATDPMIYKNYTLKDMSGKAENKAKLQKDLGLKVDPDIPLIAMVGRLSNQKGLDLVDWIADRITDEFTQFVIIGTGEARYENMFRYYQNKYPDRVSANIFYSDPLAHKLYAAADAMLVPSRFEPCGLTQLISLRYGTVPIVRETGGLKDTVVPYNEYEKTGTGFTFAHYNADDLLYTINYAKKIYFDHREDWDDIVRRGMEQDFSWSSSALQYQGMYDWILRGMVD